MHAYLRCRGYEQRLRRGIQAISLPGSRKRAPGTLRSQRGLPYNIHNRRTDLSVLECRRRGPVSVSFAGQNRCVPAFGFEPDTGNTLPFSVATGLKPERNIPLHFFSTAGKAQPP
jgi:hypothetical protein